MKSLLPLFTLLFLAFSTSYAQSPLWIDAETIGEDNTTDIIDFKIDADDNHFIIGNFTGKTKIDTMTITGKNQDGFVVKRNDSGDVVWGKALGYASLDQTSSLALGPNGEVYVSGNFISSFRADTFNKTSTGNYDSYLMKISKFGKIKWIQYATGTGAQNTRSIDVDDKGFIYWYGEYTNASKIGAYALTSSGFSAKLFLAKVSSQGKVTKVLSFGSASLDQATKVSVHKKVVVVGGNFYTSGFKLGTHTVSSTGNSDFFIGRLDTAFKPTWLLSAGGFFIDDLIDLDLGADGFIYATGTTYNGFTLGTKSISGSWYDTWVARISAAGATVYLESFFNSNFFKEINPRNIRYGDKGSAYLSGIFSSSLEFGSSKWTAKGGNDIFVAKILPNGNLDYLNQAGDNTDEICKGMVIDSQGIYHIAGTFNKSSKFSKVVLKGAGSTNSFLAKGTEPIVAPKYSGLKNRYVYKDSTFSRAFLVKPSTVAIYTLEKGPVGMVLDSHNATLTFTPNASQIGRNKVVIKAENIGGTAIDSFQLVVIDTLNLSHAAPKFSCKDQELTFESANPNLGPLVVTWYFGDGTKSTLSTAQKTYADTGRYIVEMFARNIFGVTDSLRDTIYVRSNPVAEIHVQAACLMDTMRLNDSSTISTDSIVNTIWRLDGKTQTSLSQFKLYQPELDSHDIQLVVRSQYGCADSISQQVIIRNFPTVGFSTFNACAGEEALFFDGSGSVDDIIVTYDWEFGDGKKKRYTSPSASHLYDLGGEYLASLKVTSSSGCSAFLQKKVIAYDKPESAFEVENHCFQTEIELEDKSTTPTGTIVQRRWTTGDSKSFTAEKFTHTYKKAGKYTIKLITANSIGCTDTLKKQIIVASKAKANIWTSQACQGRDILLRDSSKFGIFDSATKTLWYVDGVVHDSFPTSSLTSITNDFTLKMVVESTIGCRDSLEQIIEIQKPVAAQFSLPSGCMGDTVVIQESFDTSILAKVYWFGLGMRIEKPDSQWIAIFQPAESNQLFARTVAKNGCQDSAVFKGFSIFPIPSSSFSVSQDKPTDKEISFSADSEGQGEYDWQFGNGSGRKTTISSVSETYADTGRYHVQLQVTTKDGCTSSSDTFIIIDFIEGISNGTSFDCGLYPNPSKDFFQIDLPTNDPLQVWKIYDLTGRMMTEGTQSKIDGSHLPNGSYQLEIRSAKNVFIKRLIKF